MKSTITFAASGTRTLSSADTDIAARRERPAPMTFYMKNVPLAGKCFRNGCAIGLISASILLAQSALAVDADAPAANAGESNQVSEVVVTGRYEFLSADTSGATNLPIPIEQVPQSISLVSGDFLKAADLKSLGDIAEYTPGATNIGNQEAFGSLINIRGFNAGRAVDGVNVIGTTLFEPDYAIVDRLEIVKGPGSVVYGVSSPGGLVNFVTKSATPRTVDYLYAQGGSWNSYRVEGQVAGALDSAGRVRAIGVALHDQGDSFIDQINHKMTTLYGGINANLSDSVTAYLHGGYQRFVRTAFDGIPTELDGSPAPLARSFFIGSKNMELTTAIYHGEGDLTWHATDMLDVSIKGNFENARLVGTAPYGCCLLTNGDLAGSIDEWHHIQNNNFGIGLSSIYRLDALGLKNSFVSLAALHQSSHQDQSRDIANIGLAVFANIFDGDAAVSQGFESMLATQPSPASRDIKAKTTTVSAQSVLRPIDPLAVLLGVSYSKPYIAVNSYNGSGGDFGIAGQTSYRAGLTYEFLPRVNAYVSYSQSFNPQTFIDVNSKVLPPLTGEQYEGGLKYRSANGRLLLTGAVFKITEKNQGQFIATTVDFYKPIGQVVNKGVELEAVGQITRQWQVKAGYSYLNPKIAQDSDPLAVGQTQLWLSKQTVSVYSTYTLDNGPLRGLSFGGGVRYVGPVQTAYDHSTKDIAGYTLADATLGYTVNNWFVQLNAHNIFDRHYFINNYQTFFFGNVVGTPANVSLSVRLNF